MVLIHVKKGDESQFLYEADGKISVEELITKNTAIYNGRLKVYRICSEMEELAKHGTMLPPDIMGLTDEQVQELKLVDHWGEKCIPSGGFTYVRDEIGRRNGKQPNKKMKELLEKTLEEAKEMITKKLVLQQKPMTMKIVQQAIDLLKGAVTIVYPMKLPPHDVIRMEFENIEDLTGTQASLEVIDPATAELWFCGRQLYRDKFLNDYTGKNDKCKVIMKLSHKGNGPPGREPVFTEEQRKQWMMDAYRRQEELKKLEEDDDDSFLNANWADSSQLKKNCQGLNNVSWRPFK